MNARASRFLEETTGLFQGNGRKLPKDDIRERQTLTRFANGKLKELRAKHSEDAQFGGLVQDWELDVVAWTFVLALLNIRAYHFSDT